MELDCKVNGGKHLKLVETLSVAWQWIVGIDLEEADEAIVEAMDPMFNCEEEEHRKEMSKIDEMFSDVEEASDASDKFSKWQDWWKAGIAEFQRHEKVVERLTEMKAKMHLVAYVKSQPFFARLLLGRVLERIEKEC